MKSRLPDPKRLLEGSGNVARHIKIESADRIDDPEVRAMIAAALERARVRLDAKKKRTMVVRAVVEKQRARRKVVPE